MKRIRRMIGLTIGDIAYDRSMFGVAAFCYYRIAKYPKKIRKQIKGGN